MTKTPNKKTEKIQFNESKGIFSYLFTNPLDVDNWEIFDSRNMSKAKDINNINHFMPSYEFQNSSFADKYNLLFKDLLLNAKLNEYYEVKYLSEIVNQEKIVSDNEYIMSDYSAFENISMFFKEVVFPLKTDNEKNIFLLSGINKQWNKSKASLFIDDILIDSHKEAFSLEWNQIESIRLYRRIETFRQSYGSLGRNGIIEIITKNKNTNKKKSAISFIDPVVSPDHKYVNTNLFILPSSQNHQRPGIYNVYNSTNDILEVIEIVE